MIEIDEETVDKAIDDILGTDEPVRGEKTEAAGDGQPEGRWNMPGEGTEQATCRKCGTTFLRPPKSKRTICPACFSATVSANMKVSHAKRRERREAAAAASPREPDARSAGANGRQMKTGDEDPVQKAWDELATEASTEANTEASPAREPEPLEREPPEPEPGTMTADREDGAWGVLSALYSETRDAARTIGADTSDVIEALFRMNAAMDYMWRKRGERT